MEYKVWVNIPAYIDIIAENKEEAADHVAALVDKIGIDALTLCEIDGNDITTDNIEEF